MKGKRVSIDERRKLDKQRAIPLMKMLLGMELFPYQITWEWAGCRIKPGVGMKGLNKFNDPDGDSNPGRFHANQ